MTGADVQPFVQRCIACRAVFNALTGHPISTCAAVLTDHRKAT